MTIDRANTIPTTDARSPWPTIDTAAELAGYLAELPGEPRLLEDMLAIIHR